MENISVILVPFWIEKALKRNNFSLRSILNYDTLVGIMSKEDLSEMLCLQHLENVDVLQYFNGYLLSSWERTIDNCDKVELGSTVIPLSHSETIKNQVLSRLALKANVDNSSNCNPVFKIVDIERNTFAIVLYEGFIESIGNDSGKLALIEELLKLFYVYCKVEDVANTSLFSTYIDLLSMTTTRDTAVA